MCEGQIMHRNAQLAALRTGHEGRPMPSRNAAALEPAMNGNHFKRRINRPRVIEDSAARRPLLEDRSDGFLIHAPQHNDRFGHRQQGTER